MRNIKPAHNPEGKYCDCGQSPGLHELEGVCIYEGMEGGVKEKDIMGTLTDDWKGWLLWNIETNINMEEAPEDCQDGVLHVSFKQGKNENISISCPGK